MSIAPIGNSLLPLQPATQAAQPTTQTAHPATQTPAQQNSQGTSGQHVSKGGHHHGAKGGKSGGAQSASATNGTSSTLVFDPATGAMVPSGTVSTSKAAGTPTTAPGTIDISA